MTFTKEQNTHHLKIYPEHFSAVLTGVKRAELRKNDRDFKVRDTLHLMETPKGSCSPTGEFVNAIVTHIADVGDWLPGYVLLSIEREPAYTAPPAPVVPDIGEIRVGRLPTMNQEDYPGLGDWWVQLRIGEDSDEVLARVYGATPQEANSRAEALACRAAMLQGSADNSPAVADGKTPSMEVLTSQMLFDGHTVLEGEFGFIGYERAYEILRKIHSAMLAAAPHQEVK